VTNPLYNRRCERAQEWVSLELDGELSQLEGALLAVHLRRCGACAVRAAEMGAVAGALRDAPLERPTRPLVPAEARERRPRPLAVRLAVAATLAALAAGLGVVAGSVGGDAAAPPPAADSDIALRPSADDDRDVRRMRTPQERAQEPRTPEAGRLGGV
jgi:predicted anti-sigma-YlaC factor YlaD